MAVKSVSFILNNQIDDHPEEAQLKPELTRGPVIGEKINSLQSIHGSAPRLPSTDPVAKVLYLL